MPSGSTLAPPPPPPQRHTQVSSVGERFNKLQEFIRSKEAINGVESKTATVMFTKRQFMGYFMTFEAYTKAEAEAKWVTDCENAQVHSEVDSEGQKLLAVRMPKRVSEYQQLQERGELREVADVDEDGMQSAAGRVREMMRSSGISELASAMAGAPALEPGRATLGRIGEGSFATPTKTGGRAADGPGGAGCPQDELLAELESCAGDGKGSGVTREALVEARRTCVSKMKNFIGQKIDRKSSNANMLRALVAKLGSDHKEVLALECSADLAALADIGKTMQVLKDEAPKWIASNCRPKYVAAKDILRRGDELDSKLSKSLDCLKRVRLTEVLGDWYRQRGPWGGGGRTTLDHRFHATLPDGTRQGAL